MRSCTSSTAGLALPVPRAGFGAIAFRSIREYATRSRNHVSGVRSIAEQCYCGYSYCDRWQSESPHLCLCEHSCLARRSWSNADPSDRPLGSRSRRIHSVSHNTAGNQSALVCKRWLSGANLHWVSQSASRTLYFRETFAGKGDSGLHSNRSARQPALRCHD